MSCRSFKAPFARPVALAVVPRGGVMQRSRMSGTVMAEMVPPCAFRHCVAGAQEDVGGVLRADSVWLGEERGAWGLMSVRLLSAK